MNSDDLKAALMHYYPNGGWEVDSDGVITKWDAEGTQPDGAALNSIVASYKEFSYRAILRRKKKIARDDSIQNLVVVSDSGHLFNADEKSQDRMVRAITALNDGEMTSWVLANNSIADVTKEELALVLRKAGIEQTRIWMEANA